MVVRRAFALGAARADPSTPPSSCPPPPQNVPCSQIYIPFINWLLCALCLGVVGGFRTSDKLGTAYGISVLADMLLTTTFMRWGIVMGRRSVGALLASKPARGRPAIATSRGTK